LHLPHAKTRTLFVAIVSLAFVVQGCTTPTEPEVTIESLLGQMRIQMTSIGNGGAAAFGAAAGPGAAVFESEPSESQFKVVGPNLNVFAWPIIQDLRITARWEGEEIRLSWPAVDPATWPDLEVAGGVRYGNSWIVYPSGGNPNDWLAQHTEWLRRPGEATGTVFPIYEKFEGSPPCNNCPVGQFVAGPSRHVSNQPEYRRRTVIKWFRWGDMSPWTWADSSPGPGPAPEPEPEPEPELEEIHIFIEGLRTELSDGTMINFPVAIGDVELMALRGQTMQVVNSEVPRGTFNHITFTIDTTRSYVVVGGEQRTLNFATGTVRVDGPIIVGDAPVTTVTLQFDPEDSVSENSNGTWTMAPVVALTVTTS
jgi:hypothetical protein